MDDRVQDSSPQRSARPASVCPTPHRIDLRRLGAGRGARLQNAGHETWFYFYLTAAIFISLIIYVTMRDTKKDSAMERHV